jgi:hypothetical protein
VTQDQIGDNPPSSFTKRLGTMPTHYELLELPVSATIDQVRRAYRLKSKLYHPDTTVLTPEVATQKFRELKEAYGVLNSPERRARYDMGQQPILSDEFRAKTDGNVQDRRFRSMTSAYLDPKERSLSPGEIFAVVLLGTTFVVCLVLALVLGVARGEMVLHRKEPSEIAALKPIPARPTSLFSPKNPSLKAQRPKAPEKPQRSSLKPSLQRI